MESKTVTNSSRPKSRILLVEDEPNIAFSLQFHLQSEGYEVEPAVNGRIGLEKFLNSQPFDLVILDIQLPEMNGFEVAREIREVDEKTAILMLTARASDEDRLKGLSIGADDYITKPFHLEEFQLRVKRMLKRSKWIEDDHTGVDTNQVEVGPFQLNVEALILRVDNTENQLTALEADVMKEFLSHPNKVLSRSYLLDKVWGLKGDVETRTVDNFIGRIRKFIEPDPTEPKYLVSVRGRGYSLKVTNI